MKEFNAEKKKVELGIDVRNEKSVEDRVFWGGVNIISGSPHKNLSINGRVIFCKVKGISLPHR